MNTPTTPQPGPHKPATFAAYNSGVLRARADYFSRCWACRIRTADTVSSKCTGCYEDAAAARRTAA